ncbi:MAG: YfiR family protein [Thermoguttaceae bacterium]
MKRACLAAIVLLMAPVYSSVGQEVTPEEIRASYIVKIRPFVTLGNPPRIIRTICYYEKPGVAWNESVGQIIAKYVEKNPDRHGNALSVQWVKAMRDFSGCDVLYIPADEEANLNGILAALGSSSTLTFSAVPQFIYKGGMIGFVVDDTNRIRMEANTKNSQARDVHIDAQILEIMLQVVQ